MACKVTPLCEKRRHTRAFLASSQLFSHTLLNLLSLVIFFITCCPSLISCQQHSLPQPSTLSHHTTMCLFLHFAWIELSKTHRERGNTYIIYTIIHIVYIEHTHTIPLTKPHIITIISSSPSELLKQNVESVFCRVENPNLLNLLRKLFFFVEEKHHKSSTKC